MKTLSPQEEEHKIAKVRCGEDESRKKKQKKPHVKLKHSTCVRMLLMQGRGRPV